jgi:hypothetical protein
MAESSQCGPCGVNQNQLIESGSRLNGAFSEFAWANARQNSNCMPCPGKELPAWPPALNSWGHTYPVQSKHGEEVVGSQMNACGEAPFNIKAQPDWGQRTHNPPEIFQRFVTTDVPRDSGPEAREYDVALDVAERILRGDSMALHDNESKPFSYAQDLYGLDYAGTSSAVYPSGHFVGNSLIKDPMAYGSGKRLENLLEPTNSNYDNTRYGAGHSEESKDHDDDGSRGMHDDDDSHSWNNISDDKCNGTTSGKLHYIFVRDDRWKYLSFVGICVIIFILFIVAIATSMNSTECASSSNNVLSSARVLNGAEPQKIEIIVKQQ